MKQYLSVRKEKGEEKKEVLAELFESSGERCWRVVVVENKNTEKKAGDIIEIVLCLFAVVVVVLFSVAGNS